MAIENNEEQFGEKDPTKEFGQDKQPPTGQQGEFAQQNQPSEFGQQGQNSTGQTDFGQKDPGQPDLGQAELGQGDTDTLSGERVQDTTGGSGTTGTEGGFIGSQGTGSDELLQGEGTTGESDFASQGQGALEGEDEDIETGQLRTPNEDIEGGTGA